MRFISPKAQRGDTIIEVLISIAIIALALAISYSLANRSLRTGLSANARTEAAAIAQGQLELLKNARYTASDLSAFNSSYKTSTPFCMNPNGNGKATSSQCLSGGYTTTITYQNATNSFLLTTQWDSFNADSPGGRDRLVVYYRLPD